jgi:hypothetical protein
MDESKILETLRGLLGTEAESHRDERVFLCPREKCPSLAKEKAKLSVNLRTERFHCWVCGFGGSDLSRLLEVKGPTPASREYRESRSLAHGRDILEELVDPVRDAGPVLPPLSLPGPFRTLTTPSDGVV